MLTACLYSIVGAGGLETLFVFGPFMVLELFLEVGGVEGEEKARVYTSEFWN
jgi:hypothetical protein